ncbi:uncharacterized protein PITG_19114 [Phytophthora infestans T30-4]|uniref:C2 domain-containing protein n=1 Tax=Phytophthora infestans (strain T30-4) TaxID=403677 RepID=D0NYV6_PHYIT|nr:uncharacterized protein PITG_19114 [Phytophthora infestans T30-4]EEY68739.1 conserved hypothetical protein [Phytophthora infestans T30-4]|eukprot:XP_002997431.1 conserved hypothetical protein [Phytophthora infestans T30-4]
MQEPPELLAYRALQAVQRGNAEELSKLIQAGANAHVINAVVKTGTSPNGRPDREAKGDLLYHAVDKENVELAKVLLSNGAEANGSKNDESPPPLRAAVVRNNLDLVTLLLKRGAHVNRTYTITTGFTKLTMTVLFETTSDAIYKSLFRRGGDVNIRDSRGDTPLHVHAERWDATAVNGLVEYGADVNALDKEHRTPLLRAIQQWGFREGCQEEEHFIDVCHILMSHKATPPPDSITSEAENSERLARRLRIVKEWVNQRNVGMVVLSHIPVEVYRRGVTDIARYFAANTLVPVAVEHNEYRTEVLPEVSRRQSKTGVAAWKSGEEVLQRQVEILPALSRSPSQRIHVSSCEDVSTVSDARPALPPLATRSESPAVAPLLLYRLKILRATGLRRVHKYRKQSPYCICRLVRGDGDVLTHVQTSVHPGGGEDPTWGGQVFDLALTPENTRTCTLVFVLKHSGMMTSLNERIATGMMPFPYIPAGHSLTHKLLLLNNDQPAGRLKIYIEAY